MDKHFIRSRREALEMTQGKVAEALGVPRQVYGRWERGERATPVGTRRKLAELLGFEEEALDGLALPRGSLPDFLMNTRHRVRRPYPCWGALDDVLQLGGRAESTVCAARQELGKQGVEELVKQFARDTKYELLLVLTLVAFGARSIYTSPLRLDCPLLVMDDYRSEYGGDQLQCALAWEQERETIICFGQQRLKAMFVKSRARVDFLLCHKMPGHHAQWMTVELDGSGHATQLSQDDERAESLLIPEIRYDNKKLMSAHWFHTFLEDVRGASVEGAEREAKRNNVSDGYRKKREAELRRRLEES